MRMHRLAHFVLLIVPIRSARFNSAVIQRPLFCLTQEKVKCWQAIGVVTSSHPPSLFGCHSVLEYRGSIFPEHDIGFTACHSNYCGRHLVTSVWMSLPTFVQQMVVRFFWRECNKRTQFLAE